MKHVLCLSLFFLPTNAFSANVERGTNSNYEQKVTFGRYNSRAIFNQSSEPKCHAPLVILVPGSGANGPEEMMPGAVTGDNKEHSIFGSFSEGLRRSQVGTLAIGKPGVDFFQCWNCKWFYDQALYENLGWQDLIENLKDAVAFAKTLPCVDANRISVLGHLEGTQVAVDFASQYPREVAGLVLVGFSGESLATTVDWQLFRRDIDAFLAPDVDKDKDAFVSRDEARQWPEFRWPWKPGQTKVSLVEIEQYLRSDSVRRSAYEKLASEKIWKGVFDRPPIYQQTAALKQNLFVFTGELDIQTRPEEALKLKDECAKQGKADCEVSVVPEVGHAMSAPKGPRKQKLLDATLGPVDESFLQLLASTARRLF